MKQIQANRLISVLNMLETLPKRAIFNIAHWANREGRTTKPTLRAALNCGTSACAVGWAILLVPAWKKHFNFQGEGLSLASHPYDKMSLDTIYQAIARFTGITSLEAENMFSPNHYRMLNEDVTVTLVAERIVEVLENNGYSIN